MKQKIRFKKVLKISPCIICKYTMKCLKEKENKEKFFTFIKITKQKDVLPPGGYTYGCPFSRSEVCQQGVRDRVLERGAGLRA